MMNLQKRKLLGDIAFYICLIFLVVIVLCQLGVFPLRLVYVWSGSMSPTFNTGDLAIVKIDSGYQPKVGDIVMFNLHGDNIIHRVKSIEGGQITTQGDANNATDLEKLTNIKGRYIFAIPLLGYVFAFIQMYILWVFVMVLMIILLSYAYKKKASLLARLGRRSNEKTP
jgi:signal peptidase